MPEPSQDDAKQVRQDLARRLEDALRDYSAARTPQERQRAVELLERIEAEMQALRARDPAPSGPV